MIDAPGGGGKVPLLPEYVEEINEDEVIFRNYEGQRFVYKQPRPMVTVPAARRSGGRRIGILPIKAARSKPRKKAVARKRKTGT